MSHMMINGYGFNPTKNHAMQKYTINTSNYMNKKIVTSELASTGNFTTFGILAVEVTCPLYVQLKNENTVFQN